MKLSLINLNTQGTPFFAKDLTLRYKKIAELLNQENPDIVCLQEVSTYYHLFLLKKYLKYPNFIYKNFFHGPKGGLLIVSKLPIEKMIFKRFDKLGSLNNISFFSHIVQNGLLMAKIKDQPIVIINAHTFSDFEFDWSQTNKYYEHVEDEVKQTASEINTLVNQKKTVIIAGDFNMKKDSTLYKDFLQKTGATDTFNSETSPTYYNDRLDYKFKGKISARIDFVFVNEGKKKIKIASHSPMFNKEYPITDKKLSYLSDHIGLQVKFDIN
ncbi:endonuclease/exonuclease/phosphatase family protein [Candidatus Roizmanbacteria bacterium]|nr:endonuclease/exonuclease/phosphatase family protein [Candidatus Roizmanbacteria bacterium]